jgi:hypothetical protein
LTSDLSARLRAGLVLVTRALVALVPGARVLAGRVRAALGLAAGELAAGELAAGELAARLRRLTLRPGAGGGRRDCAGLG